ncbi:MAG: ferric reductase-like transmembrane domain-containing protein [Candidatus Paceibacterota bacterium]|jgi:predicted ferric reductase
MKKERVGAFVIFILLFLPIVFWVSRIPLIDRFDSFNPIITSIGQILGLVGMAMFVITIILSSRLKFLEDYFGGLNKIYFWHHFLGGFSLVFLLFHPMVLVLKFITTSLRSAALFFIPGTDLFITFGIIALLTLILLLIFTLFINFPYKTWKITHKFMGVVFFFAILHTFFIPSDVSLYLPMKIYMGFLVSLGILAYLYRTIFGSILVKKFFYTVDQINQLNDKVVEIVMSAKSERINFLPGQFIFISFRGEGISRESHPFSISSGVQEDKLKVIVKNLGDYTAKLGNLKTGIEAKIEGPFGKFSYLHSSSRDQVWIAGGVGITPFISMAKSFVNNNYKVDLYYCTQTEDEMIFSKEFSEISIKNSNFRLVPFCADIKGRISVQAIVNFSGNLLQKDFFLCGPPLMMKNIRSQLIGMDVSRKNIHSEEFNF